jgi:hypothetical protein
MHLERVAQKRMDGCITMGLMWIINPVAATLYINRMGYKKTEELYFVDNWFATLVYETPLIIGKAGKGIAGGFYHEF